MSLDYVVIEAVRTSVAGAKELMSEYNLSRGVIFVEVLNITKQTGLPPEFGGFEFSELTSVGANTDGQYSEFVRNFIHRI